MRAEKTESERGYVAGEPLSRTVVFACIVGGWVMTVFAATVAGFALGVVAR